MKTRTIYKNCGFFLWAIVFLNLSLVYAQYDNISFTTISSEDGLSQNTIHKIFQDSDGFFWFGTEDGLNKYDGYEFKLFEEIVGNYPNLMNKEIRFIDQDSKGVFWFGSARGLNSYEKDTHRVTDYILNDKRGDLKGNYINSFFIDSKDRVWACTDSKVFCKKGLDFKQVLLDDKEELNIKQIIEDKDGIIWLVSNKAIYTFNPDKEELVLNKRIDKDIVFSLRAIAEDNYGNLWIGSNSGVYIFNKKTKKLKKLFSKKVKSIESAYISSIQKDKNDNIWIGSMGEGLFKVDLDFNILHYTKRSALAPKLSSNHISDIFIDSSNILWVGTVLGGVNKGNLDVNFLHFKTNFKLLNIVEPDPVFSICEDDEQNLWIGTYGFGLYKFDKKKNIYKYYPGTESDESGFRGRRVYIIVKDVENNIWVCSDEGGTLKYDKKKDRFTVFEHEKLSKEDLNNSVVFNGEDSNIWIGTWHKGVFKYNLNSKEIEHLQATLTTEEEIDHGWVNYIYQDKENMNLWVAYENGLHIVDLTTNKVYKLDNTVEANNGLLNNYIYSIHKDSDGGFWLGTDGALIEILDYELKGSGLIRLKTNSYTKKDGLLNDVVYGMLEDDVGNLWMSTNKGLSRFKRSSKEFKNYLDTDGLQANEFNMGAFYKNASGEFLFGGVNGITAFYPKAIKENKVAPKMAITKFRLLNEEVKPMKNGLISKDINELEELVLNFKDHLFSFELAALEYTNPVNNKYAYKLEGFDKEWNYIANRRHITFTNLNPGEYTLRIKGTNQDGVWSEKEKRLKIKILPPYWRTTWFYFLIIFLFFCLIYIVFKVRTNQINLKADKMALYKKNEEKNAMLKEIHHRVKNNLQVVNSLLSLQSREIKEPEVVAMFTDARKRVLSMALLHERMYGSDDLIHVDISEHFKELIENLIKSYAVHKDIKYEISVKDVELGISTLTPLGLLIIEIVSNSLKYAFENREDGLIKASLKYYDNNKYELIIGDDGKGFIPENETTALGTKLIQIFAKQLNGEIEKLDQSGTVYRLVFEKID